MKTPLAPLDLPVIPAMADAAIANARRAQALVLEQPQIKIDIVHVLHAGLYSRTAFLPAGALIVGALIKIDTLLIVSGDALVYTGDDSIRVTGYATLPALAGRKQVIEALADTNITMTFATGAKTIAQAEAEFTDEHEMLQSRGGC